MMETYDADYSMQRIKELLRQYIPRHAINGFMAFIKYDETLGGVYCSHHFSSSFDESGFGEKVYKLCFRLLCELIEYEQRFNPNVVAAQLHFIQERIELQWFEREKCTSLDELWTHISMRIGIFWVHQGEVICKTRPISKSETTISGWLTISGNHAEHWNSVIQNDAAHSDLWGKKYFQIPRGRVLLLPSENKAKVYLDKALLNRADKQLIKDAFMLSDLKIQWCVGEHYTTNPDVLTKLFD